MGQLGAVAKVSKRTTYQHFASKDELITEYLRRQDPDTMPDVFDRPDLTARQRLLAAFQTPTTAYELTPLCPFIDAAVQITDPQHPARIRVGEYKQSVAARLTETAREAGATDPELLGEQLALLLDGASIRTRVLSAEATPTAATIAETLIHQAIAPHTARAGKPPAGPRRKPQPAAFTSQ